MLKLEQATLFVLCGQHERAPVELRLGSDDQFARRDRLATGNAREDRRDRLELASQFRRC